MSSNRQRQEEKVRFTSNAQKLSTAIAILKVQNQCETGESIGAGVSEEQFRKVTPGIYVFYLEDYHQNQRQSARFATQ